MSGFYPPLRLQPGRPLTDGVAKALHRLTAHLLASDTRLRIAEVMETQKLEALRHRHDAGLLRVKPQSQLAFENLAGEQEGFGCLALTLGEDDKVVGIAHQTVAGLDHTSVQPVQVDVRQQRRERAALWRAQLRWLRAGGLRQGYARPQ